MFFFRLLVLRISYLKLVCVFPPFQRPLVFNIHCEKVPSVAEIKKCLSLSANRQAPSLREAMVLLYADILARSPWWRYGEWRHTNRHARGTSHRTHQWWTRGIQSYQVNNFPTNDRPFKRVSPSALLRYMSELFKSWRTCVFSSFSFSRLNIEAVYRQQQFH